MSGKKTTAKPAAQSGADKEEAPKFVGPNGKPLKHKPKLELKAPTVTDEEGRRLSQWGHVALPVDKTPTATAPEARAFQKKVQALIDAGHKPPARHVRRMSGVCIAWKKGTPTTLDEAAQKKRAESYSKDLNEWAASKGITA